MADELVVEEAAVEAAEDAMAEDVADEDVAVEEVAVDEVAVDDVVVEEVAVEEVAVEEVADEEGDDDVVVDLFARLRAEAVTVESVEETVDEVDVDEAAAVVGVADVVEAGEPDETVDVEENIEPTPFEQRDADLTPIIVGAARKLKRVLADEQNEVLEALRRNEPVRALDALLPPSKITSIGMRAPSPTTCRRPLRPVPRWSHPPARGRCARPMRPRRRRPGDDVLGEWLVVPLRERLERCVLDGDGDNAGIGKRVRAVYREWKTQHIDEQLDDVIRTAHGRGVLAAIGTGTSVVWVCDDTRQGCSDCDDNSLAGSISAGEAFPTGHLCTPAHIGCRCILLPAGR